MSTLQVEVHPAAQDVHFTESEMSVSLTDGRTISVPLSWFATLSSATKAQLQDFEILGEGEGLHWPQLDEDLSVKGLLLGFH
jgi:hypothetical protein